MDINFGGNEKTGVELWKHILALEKYSLTKAKRFHHFQLRPGYIGHVIMYFSPSKLQTTSSKSRSFKFLSCLNKGTTLCNALSSSSVDKWMNNLNHILIGYDYNPFQSISQYMIKPNFLTSKVKVWFRIVVNILRLSGKKIFQRRCGTLPVFLTFSLFHENMCYNCSIVLNMI